MKAGRELDALVAEKVFGYANIRSGAHLEDREWDLIGDFPPPDPNFGLPIASFIPRYSTDIAAAWEIVENLQLGGWDFSCETFISSETNKRTYRALFNETLNQENGHIAFAEGLPEAICLAALKAVGAIE